MSLNVKNIVHHGTEAAAAIAIGTWVVSSFSSACIAYGTAKISYLAMRKTLEYVAPDLPKNINRTISYGVSLCVGGGVLHATTSQLTGYSMSILETCGKTLGITVGSMGIRALADKSYELLQKR
ncbi:MAG TPA: hypothetical protein VHK67_05335 [Rhabdochlamydiaceae bacterium]|jgi:hypothetical protein|nr:hypothetical protein [Rhabdochlamydiaceae bacterium]